MSLEVEVYCNGVPVSEKWLTLKEDLEGLVSEIIERGAYQIAAIAQGKAPVKTGKLRASIQVVKEGPASVVQATAPYALFVETGHVTRSGSFVPGVFFLRDAATEVIPSIIYEVEEEVNRYLRTQK